MEVLNPATGELITTIEVDNKSTVDNKLNSAKAAQKAWAQENIENRVQCIQKFCDYLKNNIEQLAKELTTETGKPIQEARNEINGAIHKANFFIENSSDILQDNHVNTDGNTKEVLAYDPLGVITNISAWNYPYLVGINIFVPALITGNAVLYKPSEFSSLVGISIHKGMMEAGVPQDIFQLVLGGGDIGSYLCEIDLDGYFFTGSYPTGQKIATKVASKLVPVGLELGGKDPLYVTDEIEDIAQVANSAAEGAFYNNGQSCCSVERIYVHEKVYDQFIESFKEYTSKLIVGNPLEDKTQMGAITRKDHLSFLMSQIEDASSKGAKIISGGNLIEGVGNFIEPTVLIDVNHSMDIMKEETFGPVIGIQKVQNDDEAIELMNDTNFGLTSSVFTSNADRGKNILSKINSGSGYLNCCDRVSGHLPWSGRGHSGLGSTLSKHGLYTFCHLKGYHYRG